MELARGSIEKSSEDERYCLHFSPEAQKIFIEHYNVLEQDLSPSGPLSPFRDMFQKKQKTLQELQRYFSISAMVKEKSLPIS